MVLKRVLWGLILQSWQGSEDDHCAVIQFIDENGRLPDKGDVYRSYKVTPSRALVDFGPLPSEPEQRLMLRQSAERSGEQALASMDPSERATYYVNVTGS